MPREQRKPKGAGRRLVEWGILAHFTNGSASWYFVDLRYRDEAGRPPQRWGRESEALRYPTEDDARRGAAAMQLNSAVREYRAVTLPPAPDRGPVEDSARRPWSPDQRSW